MTLDELALQLEVRGPMHIPSPTFATIVAYLSGYDQATIERQGNSELRAFRDWLVEQVGHDCTMHWSAIVRDQFSNRDEVKAVGVLFDLIHKFAASQKPEAARSITKSPQIKRRARVKSR